MLFSDISEKVIIALVTSGCILAAVTGAAVLGLQCDREKLADVSAKSGWRTPPLDKLPHAQLTPLRRLWLMVVRASVIGAAALVLLRIAQLATVGPPRPPH